MQAPSRQIWPGAQALAAQALQPSACARHVSTVVPAQRRSPAAHCTGQGSQRPSTHSSPVSQRSLNSQTGQLLPSTAQRSTVEPLQRTSLMAQSVPQLPQAPPLQKSVQRAPACHEVQPWASATQVSGTSPTQRLAPAVHAVAQLSQVPLVQTAPFRQAERSQSVQPVHRSRMQRSTEVPTQWLLPVVQLSQETQAPFMQTSPQPHSSASTQEVQPLAPTLQRSAVSPLQRVAPAVQALLQVWQAPLTQALWFGQVLTVQVVQPMDGSSWQRLTELAPTHCELPEAQTSSQQVEASKATCSRAAMRAF